MEVQRTLSIKRQNLNISWGVRITVDLLHTRTHTQHSCSLCISTAFAARSGAVVGGCRCASCPTLHCLATPFSKPHPETHLPPSPPTVHHQMELTEEKGRHVIGKVNPGTPAMKGGLAPGDYITHINNVSVRCGVRRSGCCFALPIPAPLSFFYTNNLQFHRGSPFPRTPYQASFCSIVVAVQT
jgi:hypothetical protein